jgi:hypothetical protein
MEEVWASVLGRFTMRDVCTGAGANGMLKSVVGAKI